MNAPDPRRHQIVSFWKSGIRILGYAALTLPNHALIVAAVLLILSELVGVVEELV